MNRSRYLSLALLAACVEPAPDDLVAPAPQKHARARELLAERAPSLGAGGDVVETHITTSDNGVEHVHYQQTIDGIPVRHGEAIVHVQADRLARETTDALIADVVVDTTPALTADEAAAIVGAAPVVPPDLLVVRRDDRDHLVWRILLDFEELLVDAHDGEELARASRATEIATTGTAHHDGPVEFETYFDGSRYWLEDTTRQLMTLNAGGDNTVSLSSANGISDGDNVWNAPRSLQVHAAMRTVWDYFTTEHTQANGDEWQGMDGNWGPRKATGASGETMIPAVIDFVHAEKGANYAANVGGEVLLFGYGDGVNYGFYGALDVVAHEYTHGITRLARDDEDIYEADALTEHFADVFASAIELSEGYTIWHAYRLGEDVKTPTSRNDSGTHFDANRWDAVRYMWDPAINGGLDYYTRASAWLDPHDAAGIGNLAFYLLAEGGAHPRRTGGPVVKAIGNATAAKIWFNAQRDDLTGLSDYRDLRRATLGAAADLYGEGSATYQRVWDAWRAVGVTGDECPGYASAESINIGPGQSRSVPAAGPVLSDDGVVHAVMIDPPGKNLDLRLYRYDWDIPGWVYIKGTIGTPTDFISHGTYQLTWFQWVATNPTSSTVIVRFCYSP